MFELHRNWVSNVLSRNDDNDLCLLNIVLDTLLYMLRYSLLARQRYITYPTLIDTLT